MAEVSKLLYLVVVDEGHRGGGGREEGASSFRYTRSMLQSTLQLMGCKARHAFKISRRVFEVMRSKCLDDDLPPLTVTGSLSDAFIRPSLKESDCNQACCTSEEVTVLSSRDNVETNSSMQFESYKRLTTTAVTREAFLNVVCDALSAYKYVGPDQRADLLLACRIRERKESATILLCGTSGCGKSTLSALLGSRLGITTVISTDSIRHMMRSFADEKQNPLLWASTYHAGECLDPVAVAEAKVKRKAKKLAGISLSTVKEELCDSASNGKHDGQPPDVSPWTKLIGKKQMAVEGFKAQSEMVIDSLDRLITAWEYRKESVVVEGVHLSLNFVMGLMKKHPSIIPFMVYITNEDKHMERFAVRAKYMTLDPARNKYVKYIRNIRTIQEYLCNRADKHLVPKINNTNVDRSVAAIHATVFSCLRRREAGEQLYDSTTNTVSVISEEYRNQCTANSMSSKGMFRLIQRLGSSRHLMAFLNTDGSVARAWPVGSVNGNEKPVSGNGSEKSIGSPMYGPLQIGKAEPVNLQFGNFGISAWPSDTGGSSHAGSIDDSRADGSDTGSRYFSSCCSSPRMSDGPAKEPKEEESVSGSEEADDLPALDSDEDQSDGGKEIHEELEGSVDEESSKTDEEYDDLAMRDGQQYDGSWSDDDEEPANQKRPAGGKTVTETNPSGRSVGDDQMDKYQQNLDHFLRISEQPCSYSVLYRRSRMRTRSLMDASRLRSRSQSIPALVKSGSLRTEPVLSGASQR